METLRRLVLEGDKTAKAAVRAALQHQALILLPVLLEPSLAVVEAVLHQEIKKSRCHRHDRSLLSR